MLSTKFQVNGLFSSGEEAKLDFQGGDHLGFPLGTILAIIDYRHVGHLGFLTETNLATFDLQVIPMLHLKFQVNWLFGHCGHPGFSIGKILAIFDLQVTLMFPTEFQIKVKKDCLWEQRSQLEKKRK